MRECLRCHAIPSRRDARPLAEMVGNGARRMAYCIIESVPSPSPPLSGKEIRSRFHHFLRARAVTRVFVCVTHLLGGSASPSPSPLPAGASSRNLGIKLLPGPELLFFFSSLVSDSEAVGVVHWRKRGGVAWHGMTMAHEIWPRCSVKHLARCTSCSRFGGGDDG